MSEHREHCLKEQKVLKAMGMFYEFGEPCICKRRTGERRQGERRHLPGPRGWERLTVCRRTTDRRKNDE